MKIGITTRYYHSKNMGALLQAYALVCCVSDISNNECVEQICIHEKYIDSKSITDYLKKLINPVSLFRFLSYRAKDVYYYLMNENIKNKLLQRNKALHDFELEIPHSDREYSLDNISECKGKYDLLITGSDQVWNYNWFNPAYFLTFSDACKISYAASIGHQTIPKDILLKYKLMLKDFLAISVREPETAELLKPVTQLEIEYVLDPTLLLQTAVWDNICSKRRIETPYMFCYFLGGNKRDREIAETVAREKNLKIVTLPHLLGNYRSVDKKFGDIQLWDVSPKDFISLIKYSDYVLTDSFHGSVFSIIYHRPFAVFERQNEPEMNYRISSLTDITDTKDRFLNTNEKINAEYIMNLLDELPKETEELISMRQKSMDFLRRNIEIARNAK